MKVTRLPYYRDASIRQSNRERAEREAIRLVRHNDNMFEKYLKKPSTTSVGFLALEKITHSQHSSR